MRDTDAAGVVFFAAQLALAHEAYEAFMESRGLALGSLVQDGRVHLPIVHAEADYHTPLRLGDAVTISLAAEQLRKRSFSIRYRMIRAPHETLAAEITTVHVAINPETQKKMALPTPLQQALESIKD